MQIIVQGDAINAYKIVNLEFKHGWRDLGSAISYIHLTCEWPIIYYR